MFKASILLAGVGAFVCWGFGFMKRVTVIGTYFLCVVALFIGVINLENVQAASKSQKARALIRAYPSVISNYDGRFLIFRDGSKLLFDDGRKKGFSARLNNPDIEDMFYARYRFGGGGRRAGVNQDPGRVRNQALFYKLYGTCRYSGRCRNLSCRPKGRIIRIPWLRKFGGTSISVTTRFGIASKLRRISRALEKLPLSYKKYLVPSAGGYVKRCIAGTRRLSVHSFGAAIDLAYSAKSYWRHSQKSSGKMPAKIIRIFERYGFIWGGNWYHYDGFHFEYRPEFRYLR